MTIQTIDELLDFIEIHFDKLSKDKYCELIRMTLQVYVFGKPQTKEEALEHILTHYKCCSGFHLAVNNCCDQGLRTLTVFHKLFFVGTLDNVSWRKQGRNCYRYGSAVTFRGFAITINGNCRYERFFTVFTHQL